MSEYNSRQIQKMKEKLQEYKSGKLSLSNLIDDLHALWAALEEIDHGWKQSFNTEWLNLEQIYAIHLFRKDDLSKYKQDTDSTVNNLINIIEELTKYE